jgi:hypothetical protein
MVYLCAKITKIPVDLYLLPSYQELKLIEAKEPSCCFAFNKNITLQIVAHLSSTYCHVSLMALLSLKPLKKNEN